MFSKTNSVYKSLASQISAQLDRIKDRVAVYDEKATNARLSQSKSKATTAKAQAVKDKVAAMKELRNGELIYIDVLGFYFLSGGGTKKQVCISACIQSIKLPC